MKQLRIFLNVIFIIGLLVACHSNTELPAFSDGIYFKNGSLAQIGTGRINSLDWSPDGKTLALATESGIRLLDASTLREHTYIDAGSYIRTVHFSPDGNWLATDYNYQQIAVWNVHTEALQSVLEVDEYISISSAQSSSPPSIHQQNIVFSPDSKAIAFEAWTWDKRTIQLWDWMNKSKLQEWSGAENDRLFSGPVFSPDGQKIISAWMNGGIQIWDVETGALTHHIDRRALYLSISHDGEKLLTDNEKGVTIVALETEISRNLLSKSTPIQAVFTHDDRKVITHLATHEISAIQIWDADTGEQLQEIADPAYILEFVVSPDGKMVATFDCLDQIKVWDLDAAKVLYAAQSTPIDGKTITLNLEGSELAVANYNGINIYSTKTGELLHSFPDKEAGVWMVSYSPDGSVLASINAKGGVKIIDGTTGRIRREIVQANDEGNVYWPLSSTGVQFSADGSRLIAWSWRNEEYPLRIWDTETWEVVATIQNQEPGALSPDGKLLAIGDEESLSVLNAETQELLFNAPDSSRSSYFAFSPDGKYLLAMDWYDAEVTVWDAETGQKITRINHNDNIELRPLDANIRFAISKDSSRLATIQYYSEVNVWDCQTWELIQTFKTNNHIDDVTINDDGTVLAAFSEQVIYIWNLPR